jgi:hypothetical protein
MKRLWLFLGVMVLTLGLVWIPQAGATSFIETFLGTNRDSTAVSLYEGWRAEAGFNLVGAGDQLKVFDSLTGSHQVGSSISPNPDATGFIVNGETITSAHLYVTVSSTDSEWETLSIRAGSADGSTVLLPYTPYDLDGSPTYKDFDFDLKALGLTSYLNDGKYLTLILSKDSCSNDFSLDYVSLQVVATPTNVPEPISLILLGSGLFGLVGIRRRVKK